MQCRRRRRRRRLCRRRRGALCLTEASGGRGDSIDAANSPTFLPPRHADDGHLANPEKRRREQGDIRVSPLHRCDSCGQDAAVTSPRDTLPSVVVCRAFRLVQEMVDNMIRFTRVAEAHARTTGSRHTYYLQGVNPVLAKDGTITLSCHILCQIETMPPRATWSGARPCAAAAEAQSSSSPCTNDVARYSRSPVMNTTLLGDLHQPNSSAHVGNIQQPCQPLFIHPKL